MTEHTNSSLSTFRAFISFTSADKVLAEYLASELRRILDDYNAVYCFSLPGTQDSQAGSRPADDFAKLIDESLKKCNIFILLWSEAARRSNWVNYELGHAKRFLIQKTKRMGREFKIIPISINKCSIPFGLSNIVRITYTSGGDLQVTLNQVLHALGLQPEHDDPHILFLRRAIFEVKTAFHNQEWAIVAQKYVNLAQNHPTAISAKMHYRYAIALLKLEQIERSLIAIGEGLRLENKEEDGTLLNQYAQYLKEKRRWNDVLSLAEQAIAKFPHDIHWMQLRWEALNHANNTPSFFLPLSPQQIQPKQPISVGINGTNGAILSSLDNQNAPLVSLQRFPSLFQGTISSNPHSFSPTLQFDPQTFNSETAQFSPDSQLHITRKLSQEELQPEIENSSWQKTNDFVEKHISSHKIEKLFRPGIAFIAVVNIVYVAFVSFIWALEIPFVLFQSIGILLLLILGIFIDAKAIKIGCMVLFIIFWTISGYSLGYRLYSYSHLLADNSFNVCLGIITAIIIVTIGGQCLIRLFYSVHV